MSEIYYNPQTRTFHGRTRLGFQFDFDDRFVVQSYRTLEELAHLVESTIMGQFKARIKQRFARVV